MENADKQIAWFPASYLEQISAHKDRVGQCSVPAAEATLRGTCWPDTACYTRI